MKGPALLPVLQHDAKAQREQVLNHLRGYKGVRVSKVSLRACNCVWVFMYVSACVCSLVLHSYTLYTPPP